MRKVVICVAIASTIIVLIIFITRSDCKQSLTTVSGFAAEQQICSGSLIFHESFGTLNKKIWQPEETLWRGGNGEFQWYTANDENSFAKNGKLYIRPTLTVDSIGSYYIEHGTVVVENCTDSNAENCERKSNQNKILNPVRSARLHTRNSFSFKYGRIEVIAKLPTGDWMWPDKFRNFAAVWLLPKQSKYGGWPRSGEIDLFESRGNLKYVDQNGVQIGVERILSTLHFGPSPTQDGFKNAAFTRNNADGYNHDFHKYELIWHENGFQFLVDGKEIGSTRITENFWTLSGFSGEKDIWESGTKMAPFDDEFFFIINVAVGGTNGFFPDTENESGKKPWDDSSLEKSMRDFWKGRHQWLPTWHLDNPEKSSLIIESVKVWAL